MTSRTAISDTVTPNHSFTIFYFFNQSPTGKHSRLVAGKDCSTFDPATSGANLVEIRLGSSGFVHSFISSQEGLYNVRNRVRKSTRNATGTEFVSAGGPSTQLALAGHELSTHCSHWPSNLAPTSGTSLCKVSTLGQADTSSQQGSARGGGVGGDVFIAEVG